MQRNILSLLLVIGTVFGACNQGDSRKDILLGKWSYLEFQMNDQKMTGDQLGDPTMEFNDDGTYAISFGQMSEEGSWRLEGESLITNSKTNEQENSLTIVEISESKLIFEGEAEGNKIMITLVRAAEEE